MTKFKPEQSFSDQERYLDTGVAILDKTIRCLTPVFFVLPFILILRALRFGGLTISILQSVTLVLIWVMSFSRNHTTPRLRLLFYISVLVFVGIIGIIRWGIMGTGYIPIILAIILSTMLGKRTWLMLSVLIFVMVACVAVYWVTGTEPIPFDPVSMMRRPVVWIIMFFCTLITAAASFIWEGIYQRMVASSIKAHEGDRKYRAILNAASDALFIQDEHGTFLDVNDAACALFGFSYEEASDHTIQALSLGESPFSMKEAKAIITRAVSTKEPQVFEWRCRRTSGELFWAELATRHAIIEGEPRLISSIRDVTARKLAEESHAKLEAELRQSQKMEAVGRLAGGVAHDFNNMLGVILGHTEMAIEDSNMGKPVNVSLHEIKTAAERSANLTRQLLVFARKQTIAPKVLDLNRTVDGMLTILRRLIGENIDLLWVPGDGLWSIKIDPTQVDQILTNLCINARDAIGRVGKLTIETHNVTLDNLYCTDHTGFIPGSYVLLAVSDNGCGMDRNTLANLFEPFFTTKGIAHGSGLGLATLYGIVKQNNGFINVYSELKIGSTFKIYFPRNVEPLSVTVEKEVLATSKGHETVLLVEDEPSILKMTAMMLEQNGYTVLSSPKPSQAIRMASAFDQEIDLLITDVVMPEMNGRDLLKNLHTYYPNLKSLFMSGYTANVIAHHGVLDEGVNFIQKPFSKKGLLTKVRDVLEHPQEAPCPGQTD